MPGRNACVTNRVRPRQSLPAAFGTIAGALLLAVFPGIAAAAGEPPALLGVPVDFILFALTLLGVAIFHHHTFYVALGGLATITLYKLGFTGFRTAAAEEVPDAVAVMDPFNVVRLAGDALDQCRSRVQLAIHGHRGFKDDPLYKSRRTLHTGAGLLTDRQIDRLNQLFADEGHVEVEAT